MCFLPSMVSHSVGMMNENDLPTTANTEMYVDIAMRPRSQTAPQLLDDVMEGVQSIHTTTTASTLVPSPRPNQALCHKWAPKRALDDQQPTCGSEARESMIMDSASSRYGFSVAQQQELRAGANINNSGPGFVNSHTCNKRQRMGTFAGHV